MQACGVCHTDLHYREGGINDDFPFLLGHEAAGVVESVGAGVTDVAPGDFVILNWRAVCGTCRACLRGRAVVLLRHPQRDPEDDARPTAPSCRPRSASARSPRRRSSPPASAPRSTPRRRPTAAGLLGCGVMAGLGAAMQHRRRRPRRQRRRVRLRRRRRRRHRRRPARRRAHDHRRRPRRPQARVGQGVRRHAHVQLARPPIRSRPSSRSPTATAPTCASRPSATPRCYEQAFYARDLAGTVVQVGVPDPT